MTNIDLKLKEHCKKRFDESRQNTMTPQRFQQLQLMLGGFLTAPIESMQDNLLNELGHKELDFLIQTPWWKEMSSEEQNNFFRGFVSLMRNKSHYSSRTSERESKIDLESEEAQEFIESVVEIGRKSYKKKRDRKSKNTERNLEIARLIDEEGKEDHIVAQIIFRKNSAWGRVVKGELKPMTPGAVKKAYVRIKNEIVSQPIPKPSDNYRASLWRPSDPN